MEKGLPVSFDCLGASFMDRKPVPSPRGPALRADPLSFLTEITVDDLKSYTPQQLKTILEQRENVSSPVYPSGCGYPVTNWAQLHEVLERQQRPIPGRSYYYPSLGSGRKTGPPSCFGPSPYENSLNEEKPWVVSETHECQFKCCHACRPSCDQRASLSLDGIVKGDIPPTAITGFGFHLQGTRPLLDARIVRNIGYRAVPWVRVFKGPTSSLSASANHEYQPNALKPTEGSTSSVWSSFMDIRDDDAVFTALCNQACTPNTPNSDAANTPVLVADQSDYPTHNADVATHSSFWTAPRTLPDFSELNLDAAGIENMAEESLPSTPNEAVPICEKQSPMMEAELAEGTFHEEPLEVIDGIAVTEESVGLGVADVTTQV
ncbi:uncharacterized protein PG998_006248 [Apiospora kogelbergensis]|uniref:uncharacterized protein n=1 Tax=Apiospora kogelbergensis TaxID=1337665 RepID=UPI00312E455F